MQMCLVRQMHHKNSKRRVLVVRCATAKGAMHVKGRVVVVVSPRLIARARKSRVVVVVSQRPCARA